MLFKKSLLYLSLPSIVVSLLQSCPGAPAQSQNDIDIKKRLKQAATKDDKPLMKELIMSAAPDDLNVADALDENRRN
jgi:hypothetical protein